MPESDWRQRHLAVRDAVLAIAGRDIPLDALLQGALQEVRGGLDCDAGAIHLLDAGEQVFDLAAHAGFSAAAVVALDRLPSTQWPLAAALRTADCYSAPGLGTHAEAPDWARDAALAAWRGAPLRSPRGVLGVLWIGSRDQRTGGPHDDYLLKVIGQMLGTAVHHLRAHQQMECALRESNARWFGLYDTGRVITRDLDSEVLLDEIVHRSVDLLEGEGGVLALLDEASGELVVAVSYRRGGQPWRIEGKRLRPGQGINGAVLAARQPLIVDNYAEWAGQMPELADQAMAIVAVPLLVSDQVRGVLSVSDAAGQRRFTENDVQTLSLFVQQAAVVLEGQRNRRQAEALTLHAERARLARDLHDGLAQDLASLLLRADLCQTLAGVDDAALRVNLEAIGSGLQHCIRDARATIWALRPPDLGACSVEDSLRAQAAHFESQTHIPVRFSASGDKCRPMSRLHELALMRLTQEALSNVRQHADATRVTLALTWLPLGQVSLRIADDGDGFDTAARSSARDPQDGHLGLVSMRERIQELGGVFALSTVPGEGTAIEATLPAPAAMTTGSL